MVRQVEQTSTCMLGCWSGRREERIETRGGRSQRWRQVWRGETKEAEVSRKCGFGRKWRCVAWDDDRSSWLVHYGMVAGESSGDGGGRMQVYYGIVSGVS